MQNNQNSYSIIWFFIRNGLGEDINWEPGEAPQAYLQKNPLWDDDAYDASGTSVVPPYLCDCALAMGIAIRMANTAHPIRSSGHAQKNTV